MLPARGTGVSETRLHRPWALFFAWLIVGGLFSLGAISIASIGLFVLPAALVATVLGMRQPATWRGVRGSWQALECLPSLLRTWTEVVRPRVDV